MKLPKGFKAAAVHCGIKRKKLDVALVVCPERADACGYFTINANQAYSVTVSKQHVSNPIAALLVNSGNANCFSHSKGLTDTKEICSKVAQTLGCSQKNILIASTGIIGKRLPKAKIIGALPVLRSALGASVKGFASSILTTDTKTKVASVTLSLKKGKGKIVGIAKGAGMIAPNMATMLGFVFTDIALPKALWQRLSAQAIEKSFNSITVDGCMSTNDTVFFLSSRKSALSGKKEIEAFAQALTKVCVDLAKMIVLDAEGATKFIEIEVKGARSSREAKRAGLAVANSNLFKCALYGRDKNWGRIVAALGAAGIAVPAHFTVTSSSLRRKTVRLSFNLRRGKANARVFTSDLTPQYVKINAAYS